VALTGPARPTTSATEFTQYTTPRQLVGSARKIRRDLEKWFRLYVGKEAKLFQIDRSGARCSTCTDTITGAVILSRCPECSGTGFTAKYTDSGIFYVMPYFSAEVRSTGELGNSETIQGGRDQVVIVGAPLLKDKDLLAFIETKRVYKVVDARPLIVALGGEVITQMAPLAALTPGATEYRIVDW
jgi:hypothetical protein